VQSPIAVANQINSTERLGQQLAVTDLARGRQSVALVVPPRPENCRTPQHQVGGHHTPGNDLATVAACG
jgi:hypothetical protein